MSATPSIPVASQEVSPAGEGFLNRLLRRANPFALPLWIWLIGIAIVYLIFLVRSHNNLSQTGTAYYNYLLDAFLHGRTNITPPVTLDLSHYAGKWYLYWGATPVIFVLPFYLFAHLQTSDIVYGCVAGILNVVVFSGCVIEFVRYFKLNVSQFSQIFVVLNFAFISPNFYLAIGGTVWYVNQVISIFYLLLFYYFCLKFLNTDRLPLFALAVIFFSLAWNARLSLICDGVLLIYVFIVLLQRDRKRCWHMLGVTSAISSVAIAYFFWYNEVRFANPLQIGYQYQAAAQRFIVDYATNQEFSLSHIPYNATYYFLNHIALRFVPPYVQIDREGNSIFSVYPLAILAFYLFKRTVYTRTNRLFLFLLFFGLSVNFLIILADMGTGWVQFGSRYFLDVIPGLFLALLFVVERVDLSARAGILLYGIYVNFVGTLLFYNVIQWKG